MESIAEVVYVSSERKCTCCGKLQDEFLFVKGCEYKVVGFWRQCKPCRYKKNESNKYRRSLKNVAMSVDDVEMSVSSSTSPEDFFVNSPPPPGAGLVSFQTDLGSDLRG